MSPGIVQGRLASDAIAAPPVFVLGFARSGTTHLQNLFAVDERFAFPNWYQVAYPHSFLGTEAERSKFLGFFVPATRVQDNRNEWRRAFSAWGYPV
jgi:hypothetical protein